MNESALTPDDLERLQSELVGQMESAGCMPLDIAHGFLSATAAADTSTGKETDLLHRVLGGLAQDSDMLELIQRFRRQLLSDLESAEYGPLILQMPRDDGSMLPIPYGWCQGYVAGIEFLGEAVRDSLNENEQAASLLAPILSFLMYEENQWFDPPNLEAHRETVAELGGAALELYRWQREKPT